jgi:hypothetical protein
MLGPFIAGILTLQEGVPIGSLVLDPIIEASARLEVRMRRRTVMSEYTLFVTCHLPVRHLLMLM